MDIYNTTTGSVFPWQLHCTTYQIKLQEPCQAITEEMDLNYV